MPAWLVARTVGRPEGSRSRTLPGVSIGFVARVGREITSAARVRKQTQTCRHELVSRLAASAPSVARFHLVAGRRRVDSLRQVAWPLARRPERHGAPATRRCRARRRRGRSDRSRTAGIDARGRPERAARRGRRALRAWLRWHRSADRRHDPSRARPWGRAATVLCPERAPSNDPASGSPTWCTSPRCRSPAGSRASRRPSWPGNFPRRRRRLARPRGRRAAASKRSRRRTRPRQSPRRQRISA